MLEDPASATSRPLVAELQLQQVATAVTSVKVQSHWVWRTALSRNCTTLGSRSLVSSQKGLPSPQGLEKYLEREFRASEAVIVA